MTLSSILVAYKSCAKKQSDLAILGDDGQWRRPGGLRAAQESAAVHDFADVTESLVAA